DSPFDDVRVREALQLAIDYDLIYERLQGGIGPWATSALLPETSPLYPGVDGPASGDSERARELVQEVVADGMWDGSLDFLHGTTPIDSEFAVLLEGMLEAVGIDVTLVADPNPFSKILEKNFELSSTGFVIAPPEPWSLINGLACESPRQRAGHCD